VLAVSCHVDDNDGMNIDPELRRSFEGELLDSERVPTMPEFGNQSDARDFVNWCLEGSYTDEGVARWWERPRTQLDGMTPTEAWQSTPDRVIRLAAELLELLH